jgi:hypothetical protein
VSVIDVEVLAMVTKAGEGFLLERRKGH